MGLKASRNTILLRVIVLIGSFLRVFRIGAESLWLDEAYSVHFVSTMRMSELILELPGMDNSPPLYYMLLDVWTVIFGVSETSIRLLSALFGVCTIVVIYMIGSELYSERVGLLSAGLLSLSSFHIWYAQDARMYTLLALLASLSFLFLIRWSNDVDNPKYAALYVLSTVAVGYTHVFGLFVILSQSVFVFGKEFLSEDGVDRTAVVRWVAIQASVGVLLLPYLRILLTRVITDGGQTWVRLPPVGYIVTTPLAYFGTSTVLEWNPVVRFGLLALIGVLSIAALSPLVYRLLGRDPPSRSLSFDGRDESAGIRTSLLLASWVLIPIVVPILISYTITPIYVQRYTIAASIGLFILVAKGIYSVPRPSARFVVMVLLLAALIQPLPSDYSTDQKEQWRESAQYVEENADSDDIVLLNSRDLEYPFNYYFDSQDVTVTSASENTLQEERLTELSESETIWLVLSHLDPTEAENMTQSVDQTHIVAEKKEYNDITVIKFVRE